MAGKVTLKSDLTHIDRLMDAWLGAKRLPDIPEAIVEGFDQAFWFQDWPALSYWTQLEREDEGFDPRSPILVRTGSYKRTWLDRNDPLHIREIISSTDSWIVREGSRDFRAHTLTYGDALRGVPPRSPMPVETDLIDLAVRELLGGIMQRIMNA